jgi:hypothetical protein
MESLHRPLLSAGLFLGIAKLYTVSQSVEVPLTDQLVVSAVLGLSALAVEHAPLPGDNPAVRSLTTGSVFAGGMYLGLGNESVLTYAVLGTLTTYAAEVLIPRPEVVPEETF